MISYRQSFFSLILALALGCALWSTFTSLRSISVHNKVDASLPDAYMENVTTWVMDKTGALNMKVITPKLTHYQTADKSILDNPILTLYRESPSPWTITSRSATAINGIETVLFNDDVNIHHAADSKNPQTIIQTTSLTVYPSKRIAETSAAISLKQPNTLLKATGMHANIETGTIQLLSKAMGEYTPTL